MDKITFYKKIGFNTLLECCYIFGDITLYELLKPLYDNMTEYVVPYNRSDELLDKIIIHAKKI